MKTFSVLPAALASLVVGAGAALAQSGTPVQQNRDQGQLLPEQAQEVAPPSESGPPTDANVPTGIETAPPAVTPPNQAYDPAIGPSLEVDPGDSLSAGVTRERHSPN